ncbi:MAG: hypothetical protein IRZ15_12145 [Bryobacteraceae bacterium]|jgi:hypothetical protein|nr:hypothetical protein [Bryobacteraceae bacterium]
MILIFAVILTIGVLAFTLLVRAKDLPEPEPVSPVQHLDERKARIYENLRDLQFEYRVGKLSDEDYQRTKQDLQRELAATLAEIDAIVGKTPKTATAAASSPSQAASKAEASFVCPNCNARFERPLKFCGECGKPLQEGNQ